MTAQTGEVWNPISFHILVLTCSTDTWYQFPEHTKLHEADITCSDLTCLSQNLGKYDTWPLKMHTSQALFSHWGWKWLEILVLFQVILALKHPILFQCLPCVQSLTVELTGAESQTHFAKSAAQLWHFKAWCFFLQRTQQSPLHSCPSNKSPC